MRPVSKAFTLVVVLGLAACTSHGSSGTSSPTPSATQIDNAVGQSGPGAQASPVARPGLAVSGARLGPSGQAIIGIGGATWLTTDAGVTWQEFTQPGTPFGLPAVASQGKTVVALTIDPPSDAQTWLHYQWSRDGGETWTGLKLHVPMSASIALSADGSMVAIVVPRNDPSGAEGGTIFVGPVGKDLTGRDAPLDGPPVWVGKHLVIAGGANHTQLFASDDLGRTWTQSAVAGVKTPPSVEGADTPYVGTPVPSMTGAVVPATTRNGLVTSLTLFSTTDGHTLVPIGSVPFGGVANNGTTAVGSSAGSDASVFTDPTSTTLAWVVGTEMTTGTPVGLPGSPLSISFSDARHGLALIGPPECSSGADPATQAVAEVGGGTPSPTGIDCYVSLSLYRTADGGHTWAAATRPSA